MKQKIDTGGPAFPRAPVLATREDAQDGLSLLDFFAMNAPRPTRVAINSEVERDRMVNPHGDPYKPPRRGRSEIEWDLRYKWAAEGVAAKRRAEKGETR